MRPLAPAIAVSLLFDEILPCSDDDMCIRYISKMHDIERLYSYMRNFKPSDDKKCIVIKPVSFSEFECLMHIPVNSYSIPDSLQFCAEELGCTRHKAEQIGAFIQRSILTSNLLAPITMRDNTYYVLLVWSSNFNIKRKETIYAKTAYGDMSA